MFRFYNGRLLSMNKAVKITNEEVWTDGDKIVYVGEKRQDAPDFSREIDLNGNLLMPGFKNAHTHSAMTFLRSYADDLPLKQWLYDRVFPLEGKLNEEDIYIFAKLAILEYLSSGITASFDMYYFRDAYTAANMECSFRTVLCGALTDFDGDCGYIEDDFIKFNSAGKLVSYIPGIQAEYTNSVKNLEYVAKIGEKYRTPLFCHNSETKSEVEECIKKYGMTPTELFDSVGLYTFGGGGFHCTYMSEKDIEIFKKRGLWAITNPCSNLKLASGIAPVTRLMKAGVNIAIGTDGAASNNALDMFREMYLVSALQKYCENDAAACPAEKVLEMASCGGALAMGLPDCDCIAEGKQADMIVIDMHRPNMQPENNIVSNLVYSGSKENVKMTMVAGKILYEDGEFFIGTDAEKIYEQANRQIRQILER